MVKTQLWCDVCSAVWNRNARFVACVVHNYQGGDMLAGTDQHLFVAVGSAYTHIQALITSCSTAFISVTPWCHHERFCCQDT